PAMKTRQVVIQAYTHIVCLTLIVMGVLGLGTTLSSSLVLLYTGAIPAAAAMAALAGAALFFKARGMRWPRVLVAGALAGFTAWILWRYAWAQELPAPPGAFTLA